MSLYFEGADHKECLHFGTITVFVSQGSPPPRSNYTLSDVMIEDRLSIVMLGN